MMLKRLSVIIPMGRPEQAPGTLASLRAQTRFPAAWEVILVGREAAAVAAAYADLPIVPVTLDRDELPPKTRCLGVAQASGEWYLFIDDDVELDPGFFASWEAMLASDSPHAATIGAVGVKLPGRKGTFFERLVDLSNFWAQQDDRPEQREWLYSAAILVRASAYHKSGGFNPDLPNGEDVDLTRRIAAHNYTLLYEPSLIAFHNHRRDTLTAMWRYFWNNGNAAQYFFQSLGGACCFSLKTAFRKAWLDLKMNRDFHRSRKRHLRTLLPWIWLNYLIMELSLEWHYQQYLARNHLHRSLPARAPSDQTYVRAMHARGEGRKWEGRRLYLLAMLQDFRNPTRR